VVPEGGEDAAVDAERGTAVVILLNGAREREGETARLIDTDHAVGVEGRETDLLVTAMATAAEVRIDHAVPASRRSRTPGAKPRTILAGVHFSELTAPEQRVLGCLIEKRWTTPDQYPLSLNGLRLACNQSTNRDPVSDYDEHTVREAAQRLSKYGLARL